MRRIALVGWHEFVKYVTRRGFLISVLMMPAWILAATVLPQVVRHYQSPARFMVIDHNGAYAAPIRAELAARHRRTLGAATRRWRQTHPGLHGFVPPAFLLQEVPAPAGLAERSGRAFARGAAGVLRQGVDAILVIPKDFGGARQVAQYWQSGPPKPQLQEFLGRALTHALRRQRLARLAPAVPFAQLQATAQLRPVDPAALSNPAAATGARMVGKMAPFGVALLLMITIVMNAASLMSAVIEEKSSRIVEVMLSCVSPREFMGGKLIGAAGASLLTLLLWGAAAALAADLYLTAGPQLLSGIAQVLLQGLVLPLLIVSFLCGLLIYCSIFLAIGSMSASLQDAQALVGPTVIVVMAPFFVLPALLTDPNGSIATVMSFIPIYTPFMMMFRLPWHPPALQIYAALVEMLATTLFLVWQTGEVFAANILTADSPPRIATFLKGLRARGRAARTETGAV